MQDYIHFAEKNGMVLLDKGPCQFCGAETERGIHECLEIFNLGFQQLDFSQPENHFYRFLIVDAHTLQHSEIHGRWNNHFHLSRLHLIFEYQVQWAYDKSPKLSDYLNQYKQYHPDEYLSPPPILERGKITTTTLLQEAKDVVSTKMWIEKWAKDVYQQWTAHYSVVDTIAKGFLKRARIQ